MDQLKDLITRIHTVSEYTEICLCLNRKVTAFLFWFLIDLGFSHVSRFVFSRLVSCCLQCYCFSFCCHYCIVYPLLLSFVVWDDRRHYICCFRCSGLYKVCTVVMTYSPKSLMRLSPSFSPESSRSPLSFKSAKESLDSTTAITGGESLFGTTLGGYKEN
jgi:hypothetical protein